MAAARAQSFVDAGRTVAVDQARGADRRVDYASLLAYGPWDDRNYALTREDLALLAPNEAEQQYAVPAFFRVGMRRARPDLRRTGPAQYPRHAPEIFEQMFGGFLIDGKLYRKVQRVGSQYGVVLDGAQAPGEENPQPDSVLGEVRVTSPNGGAESSIKVHPTDTNKVIAATNGPITAQTMYYSTNGGTTWTARSLPLGGESGDPAVDWSSTGQYAYTTTLGACGFFGCNVWFYRSNDGGVNWNGLESVTPGNPRRSVTTSQKADKEYLHVDKATASPFKDRIYVTWHENNVLQFAYSADFGNTFTKQAFSSASAELGIGSDITSSANGNVYYVWPAFNSRTIRMKRSTNGGVTWGASVVVANTQGSYDFPLPAMDTRNAFMYTSADADLSSGPYAGSVYVAWTDSTAPTTGTASQNHGRIQVARSRDGGTTWAVTTPHETADQNSVDRFHPWLAVGPDGTVHVVFYDTRANANRTSVDLYYSRSTDGGVTFSVPQRQTTVTSPKIQDGFEWGDYNGLDGVLQAVIAIYTDNRNESGGAGNSVDVYAIGVPPGGPAGAGHVPDGKFTQGPPLLVARSGTDLTLTWSTACGPAIDYATYEGDLGAPGTLQQRACSSGGLTSETITPTAGNRYYLVVPVSSGREGSYGRRSDGTERAPATTECFPQSIATCP